MTADDADRRPVDDDEIEALLVGAGTDREELASLDRFLDEIRAPYPRFDPQPSPELARLFAEGPGGVLGPVADPGPGTVCPLEPRRAASPGRRPVRRLAKVAAVTTTAALAVTLAAAAQVLPGPQSKAPTSVSGPATPIRVPGDSSSPPAAAVRSSVGATVTVQQPSTSVSGRTPTTVRVLNDAALNALSPEALARLPLDILKTLSPENLARLPVEVLKTLPGDVLARLSPEALAAQPVEVLNRLPVDVLRTLPGDTLARLPADILRLLPTEALLRLPVDVLNRLPGDLLARLPLEMLRTLPADVQSRLPAEVLRLLLGPTPTIAASATANATVRS